MSDEWRGFEPIEPADDEDPRGWDITNSLPQWNRPECVYHAWQNISSGEVIEHWITESGRDVYYLYSEGAPESGTRFTSFEGALSGRL